MDDSRFEQAVLAGQVLPAQFNHRAHLRLAFVLLRRLPFLEACIAMRDALQALAARAGKPGLYHETVTVAFMSLVAERLADSSYADFDRFLAANSELAERALLHRYYAPGRLASARARAQFILAGERRMEHP